MTRTLSEFEAFLDEVDRRPDPTPTVDELALDDWLRDHPEGRGLEDADTLTDGSEL